MNKKIVRIIAVVLLLAVIAASFAGCASSDVKKVISNFESACHRLDFNAMLDCIDPAIADPARAVMTLFGTGDTSKNLEKLVSILGVFGDLGDNTEAAFQSIKIEPDELEFNDAKDECKVTAEISFTVGETETTKEIVINCILSDDQWYIKGIEF